MSEQSEDSFTWKNNPWCTLQQLHLPCTFYLTLWMVVARMPNILQHIQACPLDLSKYPGFPCRYTLCVALHVHDKSHAPRATGCSDRQNGKHTIPPCEAPCKQENAGNLVAQNRLAHLSLHKGRHESFD